MKALILAAGKGSRLNNGNKCLTSVNGKSLIEYSFDNSINAGLDITVVIKGDLIKRMYPAYKGMPITYIDQGEQKGVVHAIECSRMEDDFVLMLGDEILTNPKHQEMIKRFEQEKLFGMCGVAEVNGLERIKKTYSVMLKYGRISELVEKPTRIFNNLMGTGNCIFRQGILSYIKNTPISQRGEKELTDLIQCAINDGKIFKPIIICDEYTNVNTYEDITDNVLSY